MRWLIGSALAWGFVAIGGLILVHSVLTRYEAEKSEGWPSTTGRVTEAYLDDYEVTERHGSRRRTETRYRPVVRYAYAVNGVTYTGERISFDDPGSYLTYTEGDEVIVYYNPDRPERAVLEVGMDRGSTVVYLLAGLLVLGCGLVLVWLGRWSPYRSRWSYADPATPARKSSRRANRRNRRRSSQ